MGPASSVPPELTAATTPTIAPATVAVPVTTVVVTNANRAVVTADADVVERQVVERDLRRASFSVSRVCLAVSLAIRALNALLFASHALLAHRRKLLTLLELSFALCGCVLRRLLLLVRVNKRRECEDRCDNEHFHEISPLLMVGREKDFENRSANQARSQM